MTCKDVSHKLTSRQRKNQRGGTKGSVEANRTHIYEEGSKCGHHESLKKNTALITAPATDGQLLLRRHVRERTQLIRIEPRIFLLSADCYFISLLGEEFSSSSLEKYRLLKASFLLFY